MENLVTEIAKYWSQYIWPLLLFMIGLDLVVLVHELGHLIVAKRSGVKVEQFALGFGKTLFSFRIGETEYCVKLILLGGYVKMLGQDDLDPTATAEHDPRSWQRAPAGKKLLILSAGVVMNVIFSALVFMVVYMIGIRFIAPVIGDTTPDMPAATVVLPDEVADAMGVEKAVGLKPGDRVLAINGKRIRKFGEIQMAGVLSARDDVFDLKVARTVRDRRLVFDVTLKPKEIKKGNMFDKFGRQYAFGIGVASSAVIMQPGDEGYAGEERFARNDRIVEIAGRAVENYWDIMPALWASLDDAGRTVEYVVQRDGRRVSVFVNGFMVIGGVNGDSKEMLDVLGMSPRVRVVADVGEDTPAAKAGLKKGDVITDYAGLGAPSREELLETNKKFAGRETSINVLRDGEVLDLKITPAADEDGRVLIGIFAGIEQDKPYVANVREGSPAAKAGLVEGAVLTKIDGMEVSTWPEVCAALRSRLGKDVEITYLLDSREKTARIAAMTKEMFDPEKYGVGTTAIAGLDVLKTDRIRGNPLQALAWGAEDTVAWIGVAYKSLRSIFTRRTSTKGLSGPVGIGDIAIKKGRESVIELSYFMAMLSALVAVFNFLPLPVLDGGHVVLTLAEKVRGRPLPIKVVAAINTAGMAFLALFILAVTYQDIARILGD